MDQEAGDRVERQSQERPQVKQTGQLNARYLAHQNLGERSAQPKEHRREDSEHVGGLSVSLDHLLIQTPRTDGAGASS